MNYLKKNTKIFFLPIFLMLLICSCGGEEKNTPAPKDVPQVKDAPKVVEASLAVDETPEPVAAVVEEVSKVDGENPNKKPRAKILFDNKTHDYGFIKAGDKVKHDFHFKNIGDDDLSITKVKTTYNFTTLDYPKEVIPPGGSGKISVIFNSAGKQGYQNPTVDVYTNYQRRKTLTLEGQVNMDGSQQPITAYEEKPKTKKSGARAKIVFDEPTYDYGFVMQGDKVKHDFHFTNNGGGDLLIKRVEPSCGCTTPDYPKEVIPPGGSGKISVVFDSKGKLGRQNPSIDVYTMQGRSTLKLKGFVDAERAKPPSVVKEKVKEEIKEKIEEVIEEKDKIEVDTSSGGM